jgi:hypothetical protein
MEKLKIKLKHPRELRKGEPLVEEIEFREATAGDIEIAMNSKNGHTNTLILAGNINTGQYSPDELRNLHSGDFFIMTTKLTEFTGLSDSEEMGN